MATAHPRPEQTTLGVSIDAITATARTKSGFDAFARIGEFELLKERNRGNELKAVTDHGFSGYRCGSIQAGAYDGIMMLRCTSHVAEERWKEITASATNISRLDVQYTIKYEPAQNNLAEHLEREARARRRKNRTIPEVELRRGGERGKTLAFGNRKSDRYGRVYDKHKESGHEDYRGCWRWELELKRKYAMDTARAISSAVSPQSVMLGIVASYYARSIQSRWLPDYQRPDSCRWPELETDTARRLNWLRSGVQPMVKRLIEAGLRDEVLECLGLTGECAGKVQSLNGLH